MFIRLPSGEPVAAVYGDDPECKPDERGRARTRLIAAAPDLYEFAKALDESWTGMFPKGPDGRDEFMELAPEHVSLWRMCRTALSRVEVDHG
jgi:hypothetical protein